MHCSAVISVRAAARLLATGAIALPLLAVGAHAQATAQPAGDPVVAQVDGQPIHLSDLKDAARFASRRTREACRNKACTRCCSTR